MPTSQRVRHLVAVGFGLVAPPGSALGQDGGGGLGGPGVIQLPSALETRVVDTVEVLFVGSTGDPDRDSGLFEEARTRIGLRAGDRLTAAQLERLRSQIEGLNGVGRVRTVLTPVGGGAVRTRVTVEVELLPDDSAPAQAVTGMLFGEGPAGFPILWRSQRGTLRFILNGGHGVFSDGNPWFNNAAAFTSGNPLVEDPDVGADTGGRATWVESWVEFGLGGVSQIGDSNVALYGAATGIAVAARGQDIFRDDPRQSVDLEKAYAGLLWASDDQQRGVDLSVGRLNFSLNDGFLISQFGSQYNAGPRPGIYLAPRTTHDFAAVCTIGLGKWTATGFFLDPNEYEPLESNTHLAGGNLRHSFGEGFYADATYITAVESETRYAAPSGPIGTREGLQTYAAHVRWSDADLLPGVWVESELAHQQHSDFDMRAWAGYGTVGYIARETPWTPSISYRFSAFSGDDPGTRRYERFDALFSGGLSEWLQGISFGKVVRPENRLSHRIRLNVAPIEQLNLTLDWFFHQADELNNLGANPALANLSSHELGHEAQFAARWSISERVYFLGIAAIAFPGNAIKSAADGNVDNWTTLQAQIFWSF